MRTEVPELLTVEEVAQRFKFTEAAIYHMVGRREIPHLKMGRKLRFVSNDLVEWLGQQKISIYDPKGIQSGKGWQ